MSNNTTAASARAIYEGSKSELQAIIRDLDVEQRVANEARRQLKALAMEFAASAWDGIEARSAGLATIAQKLEWVVEASGQSTAEDALDRVTGTVAGLAPIIKRINALTGRKADHD